MSLTLTAARRIDFIQAGWYRDIVDQCRDSFLRALGEHGFDESAVDLFTVPGAFEIPLRAKLLALTGDYAGIVGAGFVVNGGIYRHEFVAQAVISGLMQVQLETLTPVFSAVLTPHNFHECQEHSSFFQSHWIVTTYQLVMVAAMLPLGAIGEIHGHHRVFVAGRVGIHHVDIEFARRRMSSLASFCHQEPFIAHSAWNAGNPELVPHVPAVLRVTLMVSLPELVLEPVGGIHNGIAKHSSHTATPASRSLAGN